MKYSANKLFRSKITRMLLIGMVLAVFGRRMDFVCASEDDRGESVEIIVGGVKYSSMKVYKEAQLEKLNEMYSSKQKSGINIRDLVDMAQRSIHSSLGIKPNMLPIQVADMKKQYVLNSMFMDDRNSNDAYDPFLKSYALISRIGFNTGISKVIEDFQQEIGSAYYKHLKFNELESALRQSFANTHYTGPILIISHQKKLRIMTLQSQEPDVQ